MKNRVKTGSSRRHVTEYRPKSHKNTRKQKDDQETNQFYLNESENANMAKNDLLCVSQTDNHTLTKKHGVQSKINTEHQNKVGYVGSVAKDDNIGGWLNSGKTKQKHSLQAKSPSRGQISKQGQDQSSGYTINTLRRNLKSAFDIRTRNPFLVSPQKTFMNKSSFDLSDPQKSIKIIKLQPEFPKESHQHKYERTLIKSSLRRCLNINNQVLMENSTALHYQSLNLSKKCSKEAQGKKSIDQIIKQKVVNRSSIEFDDADVGPICEKLTRSKMSGSVLKNTCSKQQLKRKQRGRWIKPKKTIKTNINYVNRINSISIQKDIKHLVSLIESETSFKNQFQ